MGEYAPLVRTDIQEVKVTDIAEVDDGVYSAEQEEFNSSGPGEFGVLRHHQTVELDTAITQIGNEEDDVRQRLDELHSFWNMRREKITSELDEVRTKRRMLEHHRSHASRASFEYVVPPGPKWLAWTEDTAFQCLGTAVILANLAFMFYELHFRRDPNAEHPEWLTEHLCWWLDQGFLMWYILELTLKGIYHQRGLLLGEIAVVWWNWLDLLIVLSGVLDQWVVPVLVYSGIAPSNAGHGNMISVFLRAMRLLRLFRVIRILKAAKFFVMADLHWVEEERFHYFIMGVIGLNTLTIGAELDYPWAGWIYVEHIMLVIYTFELFARIRLHRCDFFCGDDLLWNILDFIIVVGAILDQWLIPSMKSVQELCGGRSEFLDQALSHSKFTSMLKMVRLLRLLRLVRLLHFIRPLYKLLIGVLSAMHGIKWVVVLIIVLLYAFAILMTTLVGHGLAFNGHPPDEVRGLFSSMPDSMFLLFKVMNDDQSVMDPLLPDNLFKYVFVLFMIMSNWAVLAILTAVVSDNMLSSTQTQNEIEQERQASALRADRIRRLHDIIEELDVNHDGSVTQEEFEKLLQSEALSAEMCDASGLRKKDLRDLFGYLSFDHEDHKQEAINYTTFIEAVLHEGNPVNERSIYRLEKKVQSVEFRLNRRVDGILQQLRELEASYDDAPG